MDPFQRYEGMFGCYAFYVGGVCVYVGKATCIASRVKAHKKRFFNYERFQAWDFWEHAKSMNCKEAHSFLSLMEAYLILKLNPVENVNRPDFVKMLRGQVGRIELAAIRKVHELLGDVLSIAPGKKMCKQ